MPGRQDQKKAAVFLLNSWMAFGACVSFVTQVENPLLYVIQALLPLAAFFICGLQKDVLLAWFSVSKSNHTSMAFAKRIIREEGRSPRGSVGSATVVSEEATSPVWTISSVGDINSIV